jgi:glycerophosphoryl diester phosphodiesterase
MVIAHRGDSRTCPEQTIAAYTQAAERGAEMIEADVHRTRDGRLVMLHDATLDRTTSGSGPVAAIDHVELRTLDAGSWFSPDFAGERVPTLDELFDLAQRFDIALCLEVKSDGAGGDLAIAVANEIARRDRLERDVLSSFDHLALAVAARAYPMLALAPDRLPERGPSDVASLVDQARAIPAAILQHHHLDLDRAVVDGCHAAELAIWAWPTTEPGDVARAHAMGVDGLMGDDVATLVREVPRAAG